MQIANISYFFLALSALILCAVIVGAGISSPAQLQLLFSYQFVPILTGAHLSFSSE